MYHEIYRQRARKWRIDFSIIYDPAEVMPWSIQFGGGGHYFKTPLECVEYAATRKWIKADEIETVYSIIRQIAQV